MVRLSRSKRRVGRVLGAPVWRRHSRGGHPACARRGRRAAELTHRSFSRMRHLRGYALPLVTVVRFDSPRPKPRPRLRSSGASQGAPRPRPTRGRHDVRARGEPARRRKGGYGGKPCGFPLFVYRPRRPPIGGRLEPGFVLDGHAFAAPGGAADRLRRCSRPVGRDLDNVLTVYNWPFVLSAVRAGLRTRATLE